MRKIEEYQVLSFPASRIATIDIGAVGFSKHHVKALVEFDVTDARIKLAALKQQGEKVSFNAWMLKCISETIKEHRLLHGILKGKRKVVLFDDIDIAIIVERQVDGQKVPLPYVIRKANSKTITEITREIESGKGQAINDEGDYVLGPKKQGWLMKLYYALPGCLRRFVWKLILKNPDLVKANMGTVMVTSLGMVGDVEGWIIPVSVHPLCIAIGSIAKKPAVVNNKIVIRERLYLTALVDHDVIDGAPAFRALTYLKDLVESSYGLSGDFDSPEYK